jgi:hypothetical protein
MTYAGLKSHRFAAAAVAGATMSLLALTVSLAAGAAAQAADNAPGAVAPTGAAVVPTGAADARPCPTAPAAPTGTTS